eukprot:scaffold180805_cov16-Prasinocladus_malaysianus.AAC.1
MHADLDLVEATTRLVLRFATAKDVLREEEAIVRKLEPCTIPALHSMYGCVVPLGHSSLTARTQQLHLGRYQLPPPAFDTSGEVP